jgi:CheY-like chemotaxis protein
MTDPINILVVDDNRDLANNLKDILHELGYGASAAFDAAGALALWKERPFDLALLDYKLPDMDGLALRDRLAEAGGGDYILLTGAAQEAWMDEAIRDGRIIALESKPLNMDRLLERIGQIADRLLAAGPKTDA